MERKEKLNIGGSLARARVSKLRYKAEMQSIYYNFWII
jgi:hypothetical protein